MVEFQAWLQPLTVRKPDLSTQPAPTRWSPVRPGVRLRGGKVRVIEPEVPALSFPSKATIRRWKELHRNSKSRTSRLRFAARECSLATRRIAPNPVSSCRWIGDVCRRGLRSAAQNTRPASGYLPSALVAAAPRQETHSIDRRGLNGRSHSPRLP